MRHSIKSVFYAPRTAELPRITLHPSSGPQSGELYECSECFFISLSILLICLVTQTLVVWVCVQRRRSDCAPGFWIVVCLKLSRVVRVFCFDLVRVFSGWIFRKCCWFSNFIAAEAGWHQSQQARHEFAAFCCYGKIWNVDAVKYSTYFQLKKYSWCWFKKKKKKK